MSTVPHNSMLIKHAPSTDDQHPSTMCTTWSIKYACSHIFDFRRSTCSGRVTAKSNFKGVPRVACCVVPTLTFASESKCGRCRSEELAAAMAERVSRCRLREGEDHASALDDLLREQDVLSYQLTKRYPSNYAVKKVPLPLQERKELGDSKLKFEVCVSDIDSDGVVAESQEDREWAAFFDEWADPNWNERVVSSVEWTETEAAQDDLAATTSDEFEQQALCNEILTSPSAELDPVDDGPISQHLDHAVEDSRSCTPESLVPATMPSITAARRGDRKENIDLDVRLQPETSPPHHKQHQSFRLRSRASSEVAESGIDLLERFQCLDTRILVSQ